MRGVAGGFLRSARRGVRNVAASSGMFPGIPTSVAEPVQALEIGRRLAPPYFTGVYDSMAEAAGGDGNPYDQTPWLETADFALRDLLTRTKSAEFAISSHLAPFAALIATLGSRQNRIRVLDFGGGPGDNFLQLEAALDPHLSARIEYHIVDTPRNCDKGREILTEFSHRLYFHAADAHGRTHNAAGDEEMYDAVILCGVLMYIDDWKGLLRDLAARTTQAMYVTRTPANRALPTFYVKQLIAPGLGPWKGRFIGSIGMAVINPDEIRAVLKEAGFSQTLFAPLFAYGPEMTSRPAPYNAIIQAMTLFMRDHGAARKII